MSPHCKPGGFQPDLPAIARADRRRVVEQSMLRLLSRQSGETGMQRMVGRHERLLAMKNGRVGRAGIFKALDLAGAEQDSDAPAKCGVGIGLEVGIDQVRNLAGMPVQLDQVGAVDFAQVGPGTALVDAQQRPD